VRTIVWDVEDVLNDLIRTWFDTWWRPAHPDCALAYQEISENPPQRILGVCLEEYLESLDAFRSSETTMMQPPTEVIDWFHGYGKDFRHVALTAVPLRAASPLASWVFNHYGLWIRSFNVVPSRRVGEILPAYDRTKVDFLQWWGMADILVDDNAATVESARRLGIEAVLMPRPWNPSRLTVTDTLQYLAGLA